MKRSTTICAGIRAVGRRSRKHSPTSMASTSPTTSPARSSLISDSRTTSARRRPAMRCSTRSGPPTNACIPMMAMATMPDATSTAPSWIAFSRSTYRPRGSRMDTKPADFDQFWQRTLNDLAEFSTQPELELLPLRTTDFATLYGVRLTSLGPYRLFGYLSLPTGTGPFPAIYYAPRYQSVLEIIPQGTANLQRRAYITFSLAARGQRNADTPYAAMFPGLLTEGIDNAASYIFRGIAADTVRGLEFLLTRPELDASRVVLVGNDLALMTAGLHP